MKRILYLYNIDNWALHNVGKLWFSNLTNDLYNVTMINYHDIVDNFEDCCQDYDYVWFSYLYMYKKFMYEPKRSIVSIHDPMEVFPQEPKWRTMEPNSDQIELLKSLIFVNVISKEMQNKLSVLGIQAELISTTTMLDSVSESHITITDNIGVTSVCNIYPRKDIELLTEISEELIKQGYDVNLKIGGEVLEEKEYIEFLRKNSIYICTSYQEGGPIPAMDAMSQGCVVLTTPVGQMLELIQDGYNGYFCITKQEFLDRCNYLINHKEEFFQMRKYALSTIKKQRSLSSISAQVESFLQKLI